MRIHIFHHVELSHEVRALFDNLSDKLDGALTRLDAIDKTLGVLSTDIKAELDGVLSGVLSPETQAKVDQIFAKAIATSAKLDAASKP